MEKMLFAILSLIFASAGVVHGTARVTESKKPKVTEETRVKIAVIDTGVNVNEKLKPFLCKGGHISLVDDYPLRDANINMHGTNVVGLISENLDPKRECILMIKFYKDGLATDFFKKVRTAVDYAVFREAKFINMSLGGDGASDLEKLAILSALEKGIRVSVAAGNDRRNLDWNCYYYPACYRFNRTTFHVVGSTTGKYSNFGKKITHWEDGTNVGTPKMRGTSQATATHTGKWVREVYK